MSTIRFAKSVFDTGRRWGARGLFRLASWTLACSINLYRRETIPCGVLRIILSIVTVLERSAALLLGLRRRYLDGISPP
jgi:hypothetical protein